MRSEKVLFRAPYVEKAYKIIRKQLVGLVLDVGCGDGILSRTHKNTFGLDNWRKFYLRRYKLMNKKFLIPVVKGDMHTLPFKGNEFDCVVINHVLEHSSKPDVVIKEIYRILKNDGSLIVGVPNSGSLQSKFLKPLFRTDFCAFTEGHKSFFDIFSLTQLLRKRFKLKKIYGTAFHIHIIGKFFELPIIRKLVQKLASTYIRLSHDIIVVVKK